jgi:hypothetical protein
MKRGRFLEIPTQEVRIVIGIRKVVMRTRTRLIPSIPKA